MAITSAIPFLDNGRIAPVDYKAIGLKNAADLEAQYLPGMLAAVSRDGDIYGLPLELTNMCLYVNRKMFREAGIDPDKDSPKTWEDVMALSEKLVKRNGQIITRRGFDFRYDAYPNTFVPMVEQLGGELVSKDGKTAIIGDAAWLKVLQYVREFGPGAKNLGSPTYSAARTEFDKDTGLVAMSFSGLYQEARMKASNPASSIQRTGWSFPSPNGRTPRSGLPPTIRVTTTWSTSSQTSSSSRRAGFFSITCLDMGISTLKKWLSYSPHKSSTSPRPLRRCPIPMSS